MEGMKGSRSLVHVTLLGMGAQRAVVRASWSQQLSIWDWALCWLPLSCGGILVLSSRFG